MCRRGLKIGIALLGAMMFLVAPLALGGVPRALGTTLLPSCRRSSALAWSPRCGLSASATMTANQQPALAYPITPSDPPDAPVGIFGLDYAIGQPVALTEDLSRIPTKIDTNQYHWNWTFGDGAKGSTFATTHQFAKAGTYTIRLGIVDLKDARNDDPNFDSAQIHIMAQAIGQPPVAMASESTKIVQVGGTVTFDATGSHAQDGSDVTYLWNFGDTTTATGAHVTHTFSALGIGFVALIVQDKRGAKAIATVPIQIVLELPTANLSASATNAQTGDTITFDASASQPVKSQPDDPLVSYQWDFGDGSQRTTTTPTTTYSYHRAGTYTVVLQVIDKLNLPGTVSVVIHVAPAGPLGSGSHTGLYIGAGILIAALLALAVAGNWWRERQRQLALAARRRRRHSSVHRRK